MSVTVHLQRVVTLRIYTFVMFLIVPILILYLYTWTHCQVDAEYGFDPVEPDRHVIVLERSGQYRSPNLQEPPRRKKKAILYWTKMFSSRNFYFGDGDIFEGCPVSACVGTNDRNYKPLDEFDAVMFHGPELNDKDLPRVRSPRQRYIFMDSETQVFHPIPNRPAFKDFFNWTMAYRRDADIMRPYGYFANLSSGEVLPPYIPSQWIDVSGGAIPEAARFSFRNKSKIAAWFVSHCSTNSKREIVAERLQEHVRVDIYGECGPFQCPRSMEDECYEKLEDEYFFYLSFENSMCRDYLTEKVYKAMRYNVVPIVYGSADYEDFLPPNSYIDVRDFGSMEELAAYLVELSQNEEKYLGYFKWKSFYKVDISKKYIICEFCRALHQPNSPSQIIGDIYDWWAKGSGCVSPPSIR